MYTCVCQYFLQCKNQMICGSAQRSLQTRVLASVSKREDEEYRKTRGSLPLREHNFWSILNSCVNRHKSQSSECKGPSLSLPILPSEEHC